MTSLPSDPPTAVDPSQHIVSDEELNALLAYDAEQRRRDREESRRWLSALAIGGTLASGLALLLSFYALTRSTGTRTVIERAAPITRTASHASAPALGHAVKASLTEMKITDSVAKVAAGKVVFTVTNNGSMTHEYVVLKTSQPAANLPLSGGRASEAGHVGEIGDLPAGATKSLTLSLKPGHYSIICNLPGHYTGGMHTDLTVS